VKFSQLIDSGTPSSKSEIRRRTSPGVARSAVCGLEVVLVACRSGAVGSCRGLVLTGGGQAAPWVGKRQRDPVVAHALAAHRYSTVTFLEQKTNYSFERNV